VQACDGYAPALKFTNYVWNWFVAETPLSAHNPRSGLDVVTRALFPNARGGNLNCWKLNMQFKSGYHVTKQ
jgi:hypothetical protein